MTIRQTAACADKAIRSTSAIYHIVKATERHGERAVIEKMAEVEQEATGSNYSQAVIHAAICHQEIMSLSTKGDKYKRISEKLESETSICTQALTA